MSQLIGIIGKKRHGKDTIANYMVEKYGYIRIAFADAIKDMLKCSFGFTEEQLNGSLKEIVDDFWQVKPRQVLQFVGTELFRDKMGELIPHVKLDFWVFIVKKKIHDILIANPDAKIVISDCRFDNEVKLIKEMGGYTFRVERPSVEDNNESEHLSEKYINDLPFDFKLINDDTFDKLHSDIVHLLSRWQNTKLLTKLLQ